MLNTLLTKQGTGNQIEMGQQNFGQSDQGCYQPAVQLYTSCYKQRFSQFIWRFDFRDTTVFFFFLSYLMQALSFIRKREKEIQKITQIFHLHLFQIRNPLHFSACRMRSGMLAVFVPYSPRSVTIKAQFCAQ